MPQIHDKMTRRIVASTPRVLSKISACGSALLLCLAAMAATEPQSSSPSAVAPVSKENVTLLKDIPSVVHSPLPASHIATGGVAAPAVACVAEEETTLVVANVNGRIIADEVSRCDSPTKTGTPGGGIGGNGLPAAESSAAGATLDPPPSDTESCELFTTGLKDSCLALPAAQRLLCQYNACVQGAICSNQPTAQCGSKPKPPTPAKVTNCSNTYAAFINSCTGQFRSADGQNSCLFAAKTNLNQCMSSAPAPAGPVR
jgi:hypothetical protein